MSQAIQEGNNMSMVENIVSAYEATSPEQRRIGAAWYPMAYNHAALLDPENPSRAAGVIAAMSPQTGWKRNLAYASQVIKWANDHPNLKIIPDLKLVVATAPRLHYTVQMSKAIAIACYDMPPLSVLHGPKERAFYGAIMGYPDAVVVDRWAARVAEPSKRSGGKSEVVTPAQYRKIAQAFREAAHQLNRPVRDVQSTLWFATRTVDA